MQHGIFRPEVKLVETHRNLQRDDHLINNNIFIVSLPDFMRSTRKKLKMIENFEFDPSDYENEDGCQIYKTKNIVLNKQFFLKKARIGDSKGQEGNSEILSEIAILSELNHPSVIRCHKILKTKKSLYLILDFCPGAKISAFFRNPEQFFLDQSMRSRTIGYPQILKVSSEIAKALQYIHSRRIVHRALNPSNIYFDIENMQIKITNFSKAVKLDYLDQKKKLSTPAAQVGEFDHPDVNKQVSQQTDLYSLGQIIKALIKAAEWEPLSPQQNQFVSMAYKLTQIKPDSSVESKQICRHLCGTPLGQNQQRLSRELLKSKSSQALSRVSRKSSFERKRKSGEKYSSHFEANQSLTLYKQSKYGRASRQLKHTFNDTFEESQGLEDSVMSSRTKKLKRKPKELQHKKLTDSSDRLPIKDLESTLHESSSYGRDREAVKFKQVALHISHLRNRSILLLKIADIITNSIKGNSPVTIKLSYLLHKKSCLKLSELARTMHQKGPTENSSISVETFHDFRKTVGFQALSDLVDARLRESKESLWQITEVIEKECPELKTSPSFRDELRKDKMSNSYFYSTIGSYMEYFMEEKLEIYSEEKHQQTLTYLNLLSQILSYESYDRFFEINFPESEVRLSSSAILLKMKSMSIKQLVQRLHQRERHQHADDQSMNF